MRRIKRIALNSVASASLLICGMSQNVFAQDAQTAAAPVASQRVQEILVEGNQRLETETILAYVSIRPGDEFDSEAADVSLKGLFGTGFFSDVQFEQRGNSLVVKVVENPTVNQVLIEGQKALTSEKILEEVKLKPRAWFTVSQAQADKYRIGELYRRSGKFAAVITPKIKEQPQNRVDVIFEINEGPKTGIKVLNFIGNNAFSDQQLKGIIVTEESKWWRFFSSKDNFDPDKMEYDKEQLSKYYLNNGYYDFRINSAIAELTPDQKGFFVTFSLDEGRKYKFGEIKVNAQLSRLSADILKEKIPFKTGQTYEYDQIEKAIENITFAAGSAGYAFVDVRQQEIPNPETGKVDIVFDVDEGPKVYIERIDIIGNSATLDNVIRRELRLAEGDAINRVLIENSKSRIQGLGFFKDVSIEDKKGSLPDRAVMEVRLEEQPTGELAFSVGYSSYYGTNFDVSVTERNLRGRGQFLRFRVSTSKFQNEVDIRFTEPRFLGRNLAAGFDIFSVESDYSQYTGFISKSTGASGRFGFPIGVNRDLGLRYTYRIDDSSYPGSGCDTGVAQNALFAFQCDSIGRYTTSMVGYTLNWDKRNNPIKPTRGFYLTASQDLAGLFTGVKYSKTEIMGAAYYGIREGWVSSLNLSAGYINGIGGDTIRINDRYFKGGQTFRGFKIAGLGPRLVRTECSPLNGTGPGCIDSTISVSKDQAIGGKAYAIANLELTVPTPLPENYGIKTSLFVDFGTVGLVDDNVKKPFDLGLGTYYTIRDGLSLRASAGLSANWNSPFGPVRLDFSYPFAHEEYDRTETFRFSTSRQF